MDLGLNWVDLVIIVGILFFALEALGRPLIAELLDLLSFLLAFFVSFRYYNYPARIIEENFDLPRSLSLVLGFITSWFVAEFIFALIARFAFKFIPVVKPFTNRFLSIIPATLRGIIFVSLVLVVFASFPIQPRVKKAINESKIGAFLLKKSYQFEAPVKNVFGGVTQESITFLTIKPKTDEKLNLGFQTGDYKVDEQTELAMIALVNKERAQRGLKALTFDPKLRSVARSHSEDMFKRGYFSHYSPEGENVADRAQKYGVDYLVIGENLAYAPSLELAHQGLMNSEGHRANILGTDYNKVGIGVMDGGVYGMMFTQVFAN